MCGLLGSNGAVQKRPAYRRVCRILLRSYATSVLEKCILYEDLQTGAAFRTDLHVSTRVATSPISSRLWLTVETDPMQ